MILCANTAIRPMKTLGYDHEAIPNASRNENSKPWKNPTPRGIQTIDIPKRKNFVTPLSNQPRIKKKNKGILITNGIAFLTIWHPLADTYA